MRSAPHVGAVIVLALMVALLVGLASFAITSAAWSSSQNASGLVNAWSGSGDSDGDDVPDIPDNCPLVANADQADGDGDGVGNVCDNCPDDHNPDQTNTDAIVNPPGDSPGDACDADDDDDTVLDGEDADPLDPFACRDVDSDTCDDCAVLAVPAPPNDGTDTDYDGLCDAGDLDDDNDGWFDFIENYLGTDPLDSCPNGSTHDAWALDINRDTFVTVVGDVISFYGRIGGTGGPPRSDNWWVRLDLNGDNHITVVGDVLKFSGKIGQSCT